MTRTSTRLVSVDPTGRTSPLCRKRRSMTWASSGRSPISSRNTVPPSATARRPRFLATAPVNAPRSCPNSSLSSSSRVSAPQFTVVRRTRSRVLSRWIAVATSSFPVPVSPCINTETSGGANFLIRSKSARMGALRPMMPWNEGRSGPAIRAQLRRRAGVATGGHRNAQPHEGAPRRAGLRALLQLRLRASGLSAPFSMCAVIARGGIAGQCPIFETFTFVDVSSDLTRSASSAVGGRSDTL